MRDNSKGFTLTEILVVLCLLAAIAALGLVMSWNNYRSYSFLAQRNLLVELLQKARGQALTNIDQSPHGLYVNQVSGDLVLFEGGSFVARNTSKDVIFPGCSYGLSGLDEVVFTQLNGRPGSIGNIILQDSNKQAIVSISAEGQINY